MVMWCSGRLLMKVCKALGLVPNAIEVTKLLAKTMGFVRSPSFNHVQEMYNSK